MKKSSLLGIKESIIRFKNSKEHSGSNGDAIYQSDEELENAVHDKDISPNEEKCCNKLNFKRKGALFKVLPWMKKCNLKSKKSEPQIRCGSQEIPHGEYCTTSTIIKNVNAKIASSNNKCTCQNPTECSEQMCCSENEQSSCEVCSLITTQNTKNSSTKNVIFEAQERPSASNCTFPHLDTESQDCECNEEKTVNSLSALIPKTSQFEHSLRMGSLTQELFKLSKCGWYWGPITRNEADEKLFGQPDGAFLVRDSSDDRHLLSLSFRSMGQTLHTRIEHSNGLFSFYAQKDQEGHSSIIELIGHSIKFSQSGVYCYSRSRSPGSQSYPVRLTKPISRFTQVRSLQYLCRFVIRQYTRFDHIQKLPLPATIKGYLEEAHY